MASLRPMLSIAREEIVATAATTAAASSPAVGLAARTTIVHAAERTALGGAKTQVASMSTMSRTVETLQGATGRSSGILPDAIANNLSSSVRQQVENALQQGTEEAVEQLQGGGGPMH